MEIRLPRWPEALWVGLSARAFPPAAGEADAGSARVRTWRVSGAAVPCGHWRASFGCGVAEIGALWATSDAEHPQTARLFHVALGLRGGVELRVMARLALRASAEALLSPLRQKLQIEGVPLWTTPLVTGTVGAGALISF
jgi:hypothetical protein